MGGETNPAAFVRATIPMVRSPILVVQWSKTSIWRRWYGGQQDQSGSVRQSHYFGGLGATIPTVRSPILVVWWSKTSIWWRRYDGQQDQFGGVRRSHYFNGLAIGPPPQAAPLAKSLVLVVYLIYKFKLKKYDHYGK